MIKIWHVAFNPVVDYFQQRHLRVLLPGLPIHLWNEPALMAIGNSLGTFISMDSVNLNYANIKVARVLVEMDIHHGLPEVLEIDWRGQLISQRLDFLGIPFRCSYCRRTGHLRRDCSKFPPPEAILDPAKESTFNGYISSPNHPADVPLYKVMTLLRRMI